MNDSSRFAQLKMWWSNQSRFVKGVIIAAFVVIVVIVLKNGSNTDSATTLTIHPQTLDRTVRASGKVVSSTDLTLSFPQSNLVRTVAVGTGDKVAKGKILAVLENGKERASVTSAKGVLLAAEARYQKVLEGSSNEQVRLAQVKLENAKNQNDTLVENARRTLLSSSLEARADSGSSVLDAPTFSGTYTGSEGQYQITYDNGFGASAYSVKFHGLETGSARVSTTTPQPFGTKGLFILFPKNFDLAQSKYWTVDIPNKQSVVYVDNLNRYNDALKNRDAAIASAQAELDLTRATARQSDIDAALADVVTAQAGVQQATAALENTILRAPADGTITRVDVKVGEVPKALEGIITLQDVGNLYLEADVNESSVPLLALGQEVSVTFDAFGPSKTYMATISSIDPSATITDGVVNYKIKALLTSIEGIRPGMTANMTVTTSHKSGVIAVPKRAIFQKMGKNYITVILDARRNKTIAKEVNIGAEGDGDMVEILSGLVQGDQISTVPVQ